jgi:hypothetical protein
VAILRECACWLRGNFRGARDAWAVGGEDLPSGWMPGAAMLEGQFGPWAGALERLAAALEACGDSVGGMAEPS